VHVWHGSPCIKYGIYPRAPVHGTFEFKISVMYECDPQT
jgi:hypothetical protein